MGKLLKSWVFFTALLLFLLAAAVTLPGLKTALFGQTEVQIAETVDGMEAQARAVWARLQP